MKIAYVDDEYFNLDAIIATNTNIACDFDQNTPVEFFPLIGQRAPNSVGEKGLRTGVVAWMVAAVDYNCTLTVPSAYNTVSRDVINAGAKVANFERLQRHFYTLGALVARLAGGTEGRAIAGALIAAFTQRVGMITRRAVDTAAKPSQLDETEKRLFAVCQRAERAMNAWWRGDNALTRQMTRRKRAHPG